MRSFPWDSIVEAIGDDGYPILDRACSAEDLREVVETFFTNGVFMDTDQAFTVTPDEGMSVIVSPGKCLINGTVGYETSERKLALQGPSSQDRIDTIVLRWNANIDARLIDLYVRTGVAADVPTRPALVRNNTVYELGIQDIYVAANAGTIVQQRMTDTRLENERCGAVLPFASIDTTTFYAQIQAAIDSQIAELQAQTDRAVELAQSAIDGTTAGNLQNQIDDLSDTVDGNHEEFEQFRESRGAFLIGKTNNISRTTIGDVGDYDVYVLTLENDKGRVLGSTYITKSSMLSYTGPENHVCRVPPSSASPAAPAMEVLCRKEQGTNIISGASSHSEYYAVVYGLKL